MSKIDIKINHTKSVNKEIIHLSSKLAKTESSLSYIRHQLDSKLRQQRGIGHRLNEAVSSIDAAEKRIKRLYQFIDSSMELYIQAEKKVEQYKLGEVEQKTSWWEKIGKGVNTGKDIVKGFAKGIGTAVVSTVEGIWEAITHPVETVKGLVHVITHPVETAKGVWKSISDSWKKDVVNGDAESRSQWFGRGFGEVGLAVLVRRVWIRQLSLQRGLMF